MKRLVCFFIAFLTIGIAFPAQAQTMKYPIEEFLEEQGGFGWTDPATKRCLFVDYSGQVFPQVADLLGTEFTGTITERPLSDGRFEVMVNLHTKDAMAFVVDASETFDDDDCGFFTNPLLFGLRNPVAIVANPEDAGVANSHLQLVYISPESGAFINLNELFFDPPTGYELISVKLQAQATDGTSARATTVQVGLINRGNGQGDIENFPVEFIKLHRTGH